jgi:hypothetical protein
MGFCGKRLHDRSKKIAAPSVFFPACSVRIEARAGSPWFFLRGRECGKALNYKGLCGRKSKCAVFLRRRGGLITQEVPLARYLCPKTPSGPLRPFPQTRGAKKNPNERFGFNPPKEEVEETAEVAEQLQPMRAII